MTYTVQIDDNFHHMDPDARTTHGEFQEFEGALEACKKIVDDSLKSLFEPGTTAAALFQNYTMFGDDPFIIGPDPLPKSFSAWDYAKQRVEYICPRA